MFILLLVFELIILWLITRRLTQNLYVSLFLLTRSRPVAISIISFIFFPGTVIHELSHLFTAEVLGVHTGGLTLAPEGLEESNVRTGSVMISQTDPIRRAVIGIAPFFVGITALTLFSTFLPNVYRQTTLDFQNNILFSSISVYYLIFTMYSLFAISNSMFSSPEDMEGFPAVAITLSLIGVAAYFSGINIGLPIQWMETIQQTLSNLTTNMGYITGFNIVLFGLSFSGIALAEKISGRKIARR